MSTKVFHYGQDHLTAGIALSIARGEMVGVLTDATKEAINVSSEIVAQIAAEPAAVYGINTGFGPLCTTKISAEETGKLQENLLKSHAVGMGEPIRPILTKLMMVLKVQALAKGHSGVRLSTIEKILWFLDNGITPVVPSQGSVGASGDLAPLSHLFLPLIGEGNVLSCDGTVMSTSLMAEYKKDYAPIKLGPKEGLGLINGTQFIAAHAVLVVEKMQNLLANADITGAMMIEGLLGSVKPFSPELHELRPFPGNRHVAASISNLLKDSEILHSHANCARVQDPYSLRCIPQVHGASRTAWLHLKELLEIELNSVTDNPVIFTKDHTISGGNFHGQPLAMALDYATLAAAEIGNISDRRSYLALTGDTPGVPKLLIKDAGTNSGFMIPQYTAAAIASENKSLCFPASADSIPTSLGQEDHVSMGSISGRKALQVVENVEKILGIELFSAAQAMDFHAPLKSSKILSAVYRVVREKIEHLTEDRFLQPDMEVAHALISTATLPATAKQAAEENQEPYATEWSAQFDNF
ncbi:histidine ammonia-lyase [Lewinellaceae bacterium SD302]|nr:histidine ammonia-lyase [Lewinellaceae bacterium SD302]